MSPIYRSDQAQLSFAAESGSGGPLDAAVGTDSGTGGSTLNGATSPGTRSIVVNDATGYSADEYIQIDVAPIAETRRIKRVTGTTIYLDIPLSFPHLNGATLNEVASPFSGTSYLTFFPGVYETITVPDMATEFVPSYALGTASNRNFYIAYRGKQAFSGSIPNMILLNGFPLRFPIGKVNTTGTDVGGGGGSTLSAASLKGAMSIAVTDGTGYSNNDFIQIDLTTNAEVRQIISGANGAGAQTFVLNYPLMIAHANASTLNEVTNPYTHTVRETQSLDSVSWHVLMRDTDESSTNDLIRRYVGGRVGRATISAEEGGMVRMSWDDVQFLDHVHNQRFHSSIGGGATEIVRYNGAILSPTVSYPTTQPYYFSQGSISLFGVTFARIRNFNIEISNNPDVRYYIRDDATERGPSEIQEQRRNYRMTAVVALPDAISSSATTRSLFKEVLLEGNYTAGFTGFDISLTFTRGANDTIVITSPPSAAAAGGDAQGCFFTRAPHNLGNESPVQVDGEIIMRSMIMSIVDSVAVYP